MQGQPLSVVIGLMLKIKAFDRPVYPGLTQVHARQLGQFQRHSAPAQMFKLRITGRLDQRLRYRTGQPRKVTFDGQSFCRRRDIEKPIQPLEDLTFVIPRMTAQYQGQSAGQCPRSRQVIAQQCPDL